MTFTSTPPTTPGDYKWRDNKDWDGIAMTLVEDLEASDGSLVRVGDGEAIPLPKGGEWCRMVPAEEIDRTWKESRDVDITGNGHWVRKDWKNSRARRVMEGKE